MPEKSIADRIRDARQKLSLSQSHAAKAWGLNQRAIEDWEQGRHEPRGLYREKIEAILKEAEES